MKNLIQYINECLLLEADGSWGEKFESIICNSVNSCGRTYGEQYTNDCIKNKLTNIDGLAHNIYESIRKVIGDQQLHKLPAENPTTKQWAEYGAFQRLPNATPKTDIISRDGKFRISVKSAVGARLMSGSVCEALATLRAAVEAVGDSKAQEELKKLHDILAGKETRGRIKGTARGILKKVKSSQDPTTDDDSMSKIRSMNDIKEYIDQFTTNYVSNHDDVFEAVIREAITGEVKFGLNSESCCNYILIWHNDGSCELYDVEEYIRKFKHEYKIYSAYKSSSVKIRGTKTGERDVWVVMSISNDGNLK